MSLSFLGVASPALEIEPGAYCLSPYFVLWGVSFIGLFAVGAGVLWAFFHLPLRRLGAALWICDLVAAWLLTATLAHLGQFGYWREGFGAPHALWALMISLGLLVLLRLLPTPLRRPNTLFILSILVWGALLIAGENFLEQMEEDHSRLSRNPQSLLADPSTARSLLARALLLRRIEQPVRESTEKALAILRKSDQAGDPGQAALVAFRLHTLPSLLERYERELVRLHTYQWLQIGLLLALLLVWGLGAPLELHWD